jgi:hypothetical protein
MAKAQFKTEAVCFRFFKVFLPFEHKSKAKRNVP